MRACLVLSVPSVTGIVRVARALDQRDCHGVTGLVGRDRRDKGAPVGELLAVDGLDGLADLDARLSRHRPWRRGGSTVRRLVGMPTSVSTSTNTRIAESKLTTTPAESTVMRFQVGRPRYVVERARSSSASESSASLRRMHGEKASSSC